MHTKTLKQLSALLHAKQISAVELATLYLDRIRQSELNAFIDVNDALTLPADLVVPAALGGLLVDEVVDRLECRAICGPANNQLATPEVAASLHARGILWAPDFVVNAGGVLYAALVEFAGAAKDEALARVRGIGATTGELLALAEAEGTAPLVAAERLAHARLAAR
jgi:leucine dehydrogenase